MKPIASAQLIGTTDVLKALDRLSDALAGKALETALVAGALEIMNAAKVKVPRLTGSLGRSIHIGGFTEESADFDPSSDISQHGVRYSDIKGNKSKRNEAEVHIGTNVEYGPAVCFGSARRVAKPYLRPAFDEFGDKAKDKVSAVLKHQLSKATR